MKPRESVRQEICSLDKTMPYRVVSSDFIEEKVIPVMTNDVTSSRAKPELKRIFVYTHIVALQIEYVLSTYAQTHTQKRNL
jgi:hypothetical protein